ncbi:30S ribosomal protein S15 [Bacteroidota bacterium]
MARMHSRKRGKAGSTKPAKKVLPSWVKYKSKEVELLVVKYAKEGMTASEVGIRLRDRYGIPDVKLVVGKTISAILKDKNLLKDIPEDLLALIKKSILVRKHLEENKHDMPAKRGLQLTDSKINRLIKYYKGTGRLPAEWKFDPKRASFYLE